MRSPKGRGFFRGAEGGLAGSPRLGYEPFGRNTGRGYSTSQGRECNTTGNSRSLPKAIPMTAIARTSQKALV